MTTPERWNEIQRVVDGALDLPAAARTAYLDEACGTDAALREDAARLLDACERAARQGDPFATPATVISSELRTALADRYTVERELGHGGMATVYLARDRRHDREVAVKVLDQAITPGGAERFLREIRIAAKLTHPNVLGVHDSGEMGGLLYYVMPYVEGETLRQRLTREGALPIGDSVRLIRELSDAMAYAHARGVVHRDLKPENVLLSAGHAVVADFGIAKALAAATQDSSAPLAGLTSTGVAVGTPAYMAPEQVVGDATMNHRADLYSLGVIAYEMLSGNHPFAGRTAQSIAAAHLTETPAALVERRKDVPPALAAIVMRLLAKDPAARPQSADEVMRALDGIATTSIEAVRGRRDMRVGIMIAAALLIAATLGGYSWWRGKTPGIAESAVKHTVAVLPFVNTSGSPNEDYFSDGLTDELAHALSRVPGLRLAGRTSSYAFKGKSVPATQIGKALGVGAIVEGTVRRAGDRLRVTTQLVSAADGTVLWDSVYESRSSDVFAVQDSLTRAVVEALAPALEGRDVPADNRAAPLVAYVGRGTTDAEAYELYLKGRYYWHERGAANVARSIEYFQQAIARDPTFARAYASLALAYDVFGVYVPDPSDSTTPLIKANALRAVTLDSTLADAQIAMAIARERDYRFRDAESHYRAALAAEPSNDFVHHSLGVMLLTVGRTDDGIAELRLATQLDPLAKSAGTALAEAFIDARRFRDAENEARRILAIDSTFPLAINSLGLAQAFGGQPDSAVHTLERGVRLYPDLLVLQGRLLFAYAAAGKWNEVERMRTQLRRPGGDPTGGPLSAFADFVLGDREPLTRLVSSPAGLRGYFEMLRPTIHGTGCNPLADPLWADEHFRSAMRALGMQPCPQARPWPFTPPQRAR
ncbi:MAG: protein kinase domain-containing protein [Deltaproteobacteria bacterium]